MMLMMAMPDQQQMAPTYWTNDMMMMMLTNNRAYEQPNQDWRGYCHYSIMIGQRNNKKGKQKRQFHTGTRRHNKQNDHDCSTVWPRWWRNNHSKKRWRLLRHNKDSIRIPIALMISALRITQQQVSIQRTNSSNRRLRFRTNECTNNGKEERNERMTNEIKSKMNTSMYTYTKF